MKEGGQDSECISMYGESLPETKVFLPLTDAPLTRKLTTNAQAEPTVDGPSIVLRTDNEINISFRCLFLRLLLWWC